MIKLYFKETDFWYLGHYKILKLMGMGFIAIVAFTSILYILSIFLFKISKILVDKDIENKSKTA
ncbi:hypothetical protein CN568_08105 [Bacillus pseudomycoides]|nr:hypothetical protein CN887_28160 [Bacillus pseudomycoides]PEK69592.1 hypothetical protein CN593_08320 [Bacillus pseudomycoides]PEP46399.1 hypothetical protein CN568_08105 [Bacillus pseudomycoides]PFW98130.1 hypothetical protein COL29_00030 [Bacillus pseudomycoides]PFY83047.1 hypothetical protein COL53_28045 [Bacillus pseudomycoides]